MTTDDELRDTLRARAASPPARDPEWTDVPVRARRIHRRRRTLQGSIAAVLVVAVTVGVLTITGAFDGDARRSIVATPPDERGDLVVSVGDELVVMTANGQTVRRLKPNLGPLAAVDVTIDGESAYVAYGASRCADLSVVGGGVARVSLRDGSSERVEGAAGSPRLSADGRWGAWTRCWSDDDHLLDDNLWAFRLGRHVGGLVGEGPDFSEPVAWAPDSSQLMVRPVGVARPLSVIPVGLSDATGPIDQGEAKANLLRATQRGQELTKELSDSRAQSATFTPDGRLLIARAVGAGTEVVELGDASGPDRIRFEMPGVGPDALSLDREDRLLLLYSDGTLQVQEGSEQPQAIAEEALGAAWIPRGSPDATTTTDPLPTTTTTAIAPPVDGLPARVIAHHADGRVLELEAATGQVLTEIVNVPSPPEPAIAVTPDGATIYAEWRNDNPSRGCDLSSPLASEIVAIDRASGTVRPFLDTPARWPAVSPDGRWLAYLRVDRCDQPPRLGMRDLVTGDERFWSPPVRLPGDDGPGPLLRGPFSFGPDSVELLAFAQRGSDVEAWVIDTSVADHEIYRRPLPPVPPGPVSVAFIAQRHLGATGRLGAATFGDVPNVYALDPQTGQPVDIVYGTSGAPRGEVGWTLVDADPSGRHLLLVVEQEDGTHLERAVTRDPSDRSGSPRIRLGPDGIVAAAWAL